MGSNSVFKVLSKGRTSTDELLYTDGAAMYNRQAHATHKTVKVSGTGQEQ
jgi:hypothetical protein